MPNDLLANIETRYLREYLAQLPVGTGAQAVGTDLTAVMGLMNTATAQALILDQATAIATQVATEVAEGVSTETITLVATEVATEVAGNIAEEAEAAIGPAITESKKKDSIFTPQMYGSVIPGSDSLSRINDAVTAIRNNGGGVLYLPYIGGDGYSISDQVLIDFSNIVVLMGDDVSLTKTTKSSAFMFSGPNINDRIANVSLVALGGKKTVDGNGRNITGYTYSTSDTFYSCVTFKYADNWKIQDIYGYNGLVGCLRVYQCGSGESIDCHASDAVYDNGHSIDGDRKGTSGRLANDQSTWSNGKMTRPVAWDCAGFGVTAYAASGVVIDSPQVWDCGNDNPATPFTGGGISVEEDTTNPTLPILAPATINNPKVDGCYGHAIFCTDNAVITGGYGRRTKKTANKGDVIGLHGHGLTVLGRAIVKAENYDSGYSEREGLLALANNMRFPSVYFDGTIHHSANAGVRAQGVANFETSENSRFEFNGTDAAAEVSGFGAQIFNTGASFNQGSGFARIRGYFGDNASRALSVEDLYSLEAYSIRLRNNRKGASLGAGNSVVGVNLTKASAFGIVNIDQNAKTNYIVSFNATVASAICEGVAGDNLLSPVENLAPVKPAVSRQP